MPLLQGHKVIWVGCNNNDTGAVRFDNVTPTRLPPCRLDPLPLAASWYCCCCCCVVARGCFLLSFMNVWTTGLLLLLLLLTLHTTYYYFACACRDHCPAEYGSSVTKAQQNFVIPVHTPTGIEYVWTGDMWQSAADGIKVSE